ncbi:MAG: hypothetical protein ACMXX9_02480 [Candidatus Woesearchaeota archaeon]
MDDYKKDELALRSLIFSDSLVLYITMCLMLFIAFVNLNSGPLIQGISIIAISSILIFLISVALIFKKLLFEVYH